MSGGKPGAPVSRASSFVIGGWEFPGVGYAQPVAPGGGYVEVDDKSGLFEVAYETSSAEQEKGVDAFLVTSVPVAVIRELLARFDARTGK